jgi:hypothetical protein
MSTRLSAFVLALVSLLAPSSNVFAQTNSLQNEWSVVQSLKTGSELVLETKDGGTIKGALASVSETSITVTDKGKPIVLQRGDIQRVYTHRGRSRPKSALVGTGIGAAAGVGAGLILYLPARDDIVGSLVPAFGVLGAGIGAGIGALTGRGRKQTLIYQAK